MTRLSINLNKIALLRNQRDVGYPDVTAMGRQALEAGANGLTVHPRPDRRHIRVEDVAAISELCNGWSDAEYNIEGYPDDDWLALVLRTKPDQATLVPDSPDAKTSDCGWDLKRGETPLRNALDQLVPAGIRVSIFMDYDATNLAQLAEWGAARIELYTGPYARAKSDGKDLLTSYLAAADLAHSAGLGVNAGHDLALDNLAEFAKAIPDLAELSIGHAWTADCLVMGVKAATRAYLNKLSP